MIALQRLGFYPSSICLSWERGKSTLSPLFQRILFFFSHSPSLRHRKVTVGGVENAGSSCIFSVMLQEFAFLPAHYDAFLEAPLPRGEGENAIRFGYRQAAQKCIWRAVQSIRAGMTVEKKEIRELACLLQRLGWEGALSSLWARLLHWLAPSVFPLPLYSAFGLYEKVLSLLLETVPPERAPTQFVLLGDEKAFSSVVPVAERGQRMLWRMSHPTRVLRDEFDEGAHPFSLKLLHVYRDLPDRHVVVYQKRPEGWLLCDDANITPAALLPSDSIYT